MEVHILMANFINLTGYILKWSFDLWSYIFLNSWRITCKKFFTKKSNINQHFNSNTPLIVAVWKAKINQYFRFLFICRCSNIPMKVQLFIKTHLELLYNDANELFGQRIQLKVNFLSLERPKSKRILPCRRCMYHKELSRMFSCEVTRSCRGQDVVSHDFHFARCF